MHFLPLPFVICFSSPSRHPFSSSIIPLALDQTPLILELVALLALDHSDGETISVIRVIALGACVVYKR